MTANDVLAGRTAVISGGSRGIGLEIARTPARAGANIALIAKTAAPDSRLPTGKILKREIKTPAEG
jgi:citronellol/citronellal dehydrogenase